MVHTLVNQSVALMRQAANMLVEFLLSDTNELCRARTWIAGLKD